MRVAVIHNLPAGGARRVLAEHARLMDFELHEFCLATAEPVTDDPKIIDFAPRADDLSPALRPRARYLDHMRLRRAWRDLASQVNASGASVVLAHPCRYLQGPYALTAISTPSVYFCHETRRIDYEPQAAATRSSRTRALYGPLYRAQRAADRAATAAATVLVTNSKHSAAAIEAAYGRRAEAMALGIGAVFTVPERARRPQHLLSVGALLPGKGHDLVIDTAAHAAGQWPVVIVSPRPDAEEEALLRAQALARGVELEIRIAITDEELADCYRDALATLYLARDEPYGLASIEAQACGSPVIVSAQGGLPETIDDGVTGFAVERDAIAAAAAVDRLSSDEVLRARISRSAAERTVGLTWERSAGAMASLLRHAAG
jgi:glycosyltransferase involved in cell wall biosynthesis